MIYFIVNRKILKMKNLKDFKGLKKNELKLVKGGAYHLLVNCCGRWYPASRPNCPVCGRGTV